MTKSPSLPMLKPCLSGCRWGSTAPEHQGHGVHAPNCPNAKGPTPVASIEYANDVIQGAN